MSYNEGDEWRTVGQGNRRNNRQENHENEWQTVVQGNRRQNGQEGGSEGAWRPNDDKDERRKQQSGSYNQRYQPDEQDFPTLGKHDNSSKKQNEVNDQGSWRPQLHCHTSSHKEDGQSKFSMRGMFSALKKTVKDTLKAKYHELTDEMRHDFKLPANEQHYAEPVSSSDVLVEPTRDELNDVTLAASKLWDLDINRLTPGKDYQISVGDGKKMYQKEDMAENALFKHLDPSVFRRPTYARFYALLDNYSADEALSERITSQEQQEEIAFIEEISRTAPIQYLQKYLEAKDIIRGNDHQFKQALRTLWFDLYNRGGTRDSSSAFEHVFVGEIKRGRRNDNSEVSGLHNWIQFYVEEAKGTLDYQGFILPRRRGDPEPDCQSQLLTVQFEWNGLTKPLSSTLIGVSPEFELALYTLCFFAGGEDNYVNLGPYLVNVKVYHLGRQCIGSAYPIAVE